MILRSTPDRAKWLLDQIREELEFFDQRLGLNNYGCMFKYDREFCKSGQDGAIIRRL